MSIDSFFVFKANRWFATSVETETLVFRVRVTVLALAIFSPS